MNHLAYRLRTIIGSLLHNQMNYITINHLEPILSSSIINKALTLVRRSAIPL